MKLEEPQPVHFVPVSQMATSDFFGGILGYWPPRISEGGQNMPTATGIGDLRI